MAASAVKRQPGYKNVLEVYVSNENTFTRVTMKRSDSSPFADCMLKTIYFVEVVEESCFVVLISLRKLFTKIRNPKLVPGAK